MHIICPMMARTKEPYYSQFWMRADTNNMYAECLGCCCQAMTRHIAVHIQSWGGVPQLESNDHSRATLWSWKQLNPFTPDQPFCGLRMTTVVSGRQRATFFHPPISWVPSQTASSTAWCEKMRVGVTVFLWQTCLKKKWDPSWWTLRWGGCPELIF
jgi:hypothetical protein